MGKGNGHRWELRELRGRNSEFLCLLSYTEPAMEQKTFPATHACFFSFLALSSAEENPEERGGLRG